MSQSAKKLRASDLIKAVFGLGILYMVGSYAYETYLEVDQPIRPVEGVGFGADDVGGIIGAAKTNELYFKSKFHGQILNAQGAFKEANKDFGRYHISVNVGANTVACESNDPYTLDRASRMFPGESVNIYGVIDDTWIGDLQL